MAKHLKVEKKKQSVRFSRNRGWAFILTCLVLPSLAGCQLGSSPTPTATLPATQTPTASVTPAPTSTPTPSATPTQTATYTAIPTSTPGNTPVPQQATKVVQCPGAPQSRLVLNRMAQVSLDPPVANRIRSLPGLAGRQVGLAEAGDIVVVDGGPQCADGYTWWHVLSFDGLQGWTAEGDETGYWLLPIQAAVLAGGDGPNRVTLSASQVQGANDIEAAINRATASGTRPGTVILDGRQGPFAFTDLDRSLNLFVSDLTLRGVNNALIQSCEGGLSFDDLPLQNIVVEGITFLCSGDGVTSDGAHQDVTLRNNIIQADGYGIILQGSPRNWLIEHNWIEAPANAIEITGARAIILEHNYIAGKVGILLRKCSEFRIYQNIIRANSWGLQLLEQSSQNRVQLNQIYYELDAGIILGEGARDNQVLSNTVTCASGTGCLSVDASPEVAEVNTITGNLP